MRKISRGRSENDEPLSAGRVEYLEQARQRVRTRRGAVQRGLEAADDELARALQRANRDTP